MKKRVCLWLSLMLVLVLILSSCTAKPVEPPVKTPEPVTTTTPPPPPVFTPSPAPPAQVPASFNVGDLSITPAEVGIDMPVTISITVFNYGDIAGDYILSLKIDGATEKVEKVSLGGRSNQKFTFTISRSVVKIYAVNIEGETGNFTVLPERIVRVDEQILLNTKGNPVIIKNNPKAVDLSWVELREFLLNDDTDSVHTVPGEWGYIDFAIRLHNNAEAKGVKAAFVIVQLGPSWLLPNGGYHYLNAFQTTDRGLLYIDCISFNMTTNQDKTVDLRVSGFYVPQTILGNPAGPPGLGHMGQILAIKATEW